MEGPSPDLVNETVLETPRLVLRPPEVDDAPHLYALLAGPERLPVTAGLRWDGPDDLAVIDDWVRRFRTNSFADGGHHWVIVDRAGGRPIGAIGTRPTEERGRADVGFWLGRAYWGRGLMTEAVDRLVRHDFETLGMYRVEAEVFTNNRASAAVLRKVGFRHEGTVRSAYRKRGSFVDVDLFGLLLTEWRDRMPSPASSPTPSLPR